jgi:saccharopine dehydrogenase-like NADP-dependent oxidoreductase
MTRGSGNGERMSNQIVVLIGAGGIGQAIARRQGSGRPVLLADRSEAALSAAAEASVQAPAQAAAQLGEIVNVVHTAEAPTSWTPASSPAATCASAAASSRP